MSGDPIANDVRKGVRERRLGPDAACALCGEKTPEELLRARRSLLERHHVGGEANDPRLTVLLCRNCHALLTEGMRDEAIALDRDTSRTVLERLEAVLRGLALFFALLASSLEEWADKLAALVKALDREHPAWRELAEVKG